MYPRIILLTITLLMSSTAFSENLNIQLSNDSARFMYITEAFGQDFGRLELEAGFLYVKGGDTLLNAGLLVRGESISIPMTVSIGARAYYASYLQYSIGAIAIGGDLLLAPDSLAGLGFGVSYYTAPGVVAFGDATDLTEYGAYVNYQITPQANVSLGYQQIDVSIKDAADATFDKGTYFSLNISF